MNLDFTVGWPLALWGLLLCPLIALLAFRSRFPIGRRRLAMVMVTRVLVVALIVLAVADFRYGWPTEELGIATMIDSSASTSEQDRARVRQAISAVREAEDEVHWVDATPPGHPPTAPSTNVSLGVAALPRDRVRRMIVATDGRDLDGSLGAAVAAAARAGVSVSVLPMGDEPPVDLVAVRGIQVPRIVRAGEEMDIAVELHAARACSVQVEVSIDEEVVTTAEAPAGRGSSAAHASVTFPDEEGVHRISVRVAAAGDVIADNNHWSSLIRVAPKPRVRILHDPENGVPALASVLEQGGMRVEVSPITAAPSSAEEMHPYALTIVDEADPNDLSEAQQQTIRSWVEEEGGGLITVTGTNPIRRAPTIFREIEPVTVPPALPEPRPLELVLVIDRSGSMGGDRINQARNAGVAAVRALRQDARAGVVAFSGGADRVMAPVGMDQAEDVVRFVQSLGAAGGTNIAAGLQAGNNVMSHDPRYIHHVILLSDGISAAEPAFEAAQALAGRGVSITAITLGPRNDMMEEIARIGRGRYHVTESAAALPALFVREAQYRQPPAHRRVTFVPTVVSRLPHLEGIDFESGPPLEGYALAGGRDGATTVLGTPDRRPLLAHWHRGLGQVATFASATSGAWANQWRTWDGFRRFWVAMAEGMLRTRPVDPPVIRVTQHPTQPGVRIASVMSPRASSEPMPIVRLFRDTGEPIEMEFVERGPGVWQALLAEGDGFLIDGRMPLDERPTVAVGYDRPYDPELAIFGEDAESLALLAAEGGGRVLERPEQVLEGEEEAMVSRSLRTPLLAAALFFYLLGLLLLRLPDHSVSATITRPERKKARREWADRGSRTSLPSIDTEAA